MSQQVECGRTCRVLGVSAPPCGPTALRTIRHNAKAGNRVYSCAGLMAGGGTSVEAAHPGGVPRLRPPPLDSLSPLTQREAIFSLSSR